MHRIVFLAAMVSVLAFLPGNVEGIYDPPTPPGSFTPAPGHPPPPPLPQAMWFDACIGGGIACINANTLAGNANDAFFAAASLIALAIFVVGAFLMVISAGSDQLLQKGKNLMKFSLIGLALVVGSYGILRTAVFLLHTGP